MKSTEKISLTEIMNNTDPDILRSWIVKLANNDPSFEQMLRKEFSPDAISEAQLKDYPAIIRAAFYNNSISTGSRYKPWEDYGFDADGVRADLEGLLNESDYFLEFKNTKAAITICRSMIEIIPEEWEEQFDYDGDVQVMYDGAIDRLEEILKSNILTMQEKHNLFDWYKQESQEQKHRNVGLNTDLSALQSYFLDSKEMLKQSLELLTQKIDKTSNEYDKERLVVQKISILKNADMPNEMENTITEHIEFVDVRKVRLSHILEQNDFKKAIQLIEQGIEVAKLKSHSGTVADWKDELLQLYVLQNDTTRVLALAEDLLYTGRSQKKYYEILKEKTPKVDWPFVVEKILGQMESGRGWHFNSLKAHILIEHEKWGDLLEQCTLGGIEYVKEYESQLRPLFDDHIFEMYQKYVEKEATVTDQKSYENVGRFLKHMKTFEGGTEKVADMIARYQTIYKRRKNMMEVLRGV